MLNEVLVYNIVDDLWVLFLGKVYNLIFLCEKYKGKNFIYIFFQKRIKQVQYLYVMLVKFY